MIAPGDSIYLHHVGYGPHLPEWRRVWDRLRVSAVTLAVAAADAGSEITFEITPVMIAARAPGVRESDRPQAVLTLFGPGTAAVGDPGWLRETVYTGRAPWDPWVCTLLLRAHQLAPTACAIASDGRWDAEWLDGVGDEVSDAAPRRIVARLFGGHTFAADATDPLLSPGAVFAGPPFPTAAAS